MCGPTYHQHRGAAVNRTDGPIPDKVREGLTRIAFNRTRVLVANQFWDPYGIKASLSG